MTENSPTKVAWTSPRKVFQDLSPAQNIVNNDLFDKDIFDKEELKSKSEFHTAENTPIKQCTIENIEYVQRRGINKSSSESLKLNEPKSDSSVYDSPKSVKATDQMDHIIRLFKKFNVHSPVSPKEGTANNETTSQNQLLEQIDENSTANSNFYDALDVRELEEASNQTPIINSNFKDSLENLSIQIDDESNLDSLKSSTSKENNRELYESTSLETDSLNKNILPSFNEVFKIPDKIHQVPPTFDNKYPDIKNVNPSNFRASIQSVDSTFSLDSLNDGNEEISKIKSHNFHEQLPELNFDNGLENYLIDRPSNSNEFSPNQKIINLNPSVLSELISDKDMEEFLINETKIRTEWNDNKDKSEFFKNDLNDIEKNMEKVILSSPKIISVQNIDNVTKEILTEKTKEITKKNIHNVNSEFYHFETKLEDTHLEKISHKILNENKSLSESIHESAINETFDSTTNLIGNEQIEFENLQFEDRWENFNDHIENETEFNKTINLDKTKDMEFESAEKLNSPSQNFIETPIQNSTLIISELSSATKDLPLEKELIFENSQSILQQSLINKMLDVSNTIENFENIAEASPNLITKNSEPTIYLESFIQNEEVKQSSYSASIEKVQVNIPNVSLKDIPNSTENTFVSCTDSVETGDVKNETLKNISKNIDSMESSFESCVETHEIINVIEDIQNEMFQNISNKTVQQHMVKICEEDVIKSIESKKPTLNTSINDALNIDNKIIIKENLERIISTDNIPDKTTVNTLSVSFQETLILTEQVPPLNKTIIKETKKSNDNIIESNDLYKENSNSSVNKILEFSIELPTDNVRNENINNQETTEIMILPEIHSSTEMPKENMTTVVNKTLDLTADTHSISFSNENECIEKENSEISKSTAVTCNTDFNYTSSETYNEGHESTSNEVYNENAGTTVKKMLNLNFEPSETSFSNQNITRKNVDIPTEIVYNKELNTLKEISEENLTTTLNITMDSSSNPSAICNKTTTKKNTELVCNESLNITSNEKLTTGINKTMELDSESYATSISKEKVRKEDTKIGGNESLNKPLNEISEENLTIVVNKTMDLSSNLSWNPMFTEKVTKEDIKIDDSKSLNNISNEILKQNLTTVNKMSTDTCVTPIINRTITKEDIETVCNENLNKTSNEITELKLITAVNKTELCSDPSMTTNSNETITKNEIEIICSESLNNTTNVISEDNLTTAVNTTMELNSEATSITISNKTVTKDGIENFNNISNEISQDSLTTVDINVLESNSDQSMTTIFNETIKKEVNEIVCRGSLNNTTNVIFEDNLTTAVNTTMDLDSESSVNTICNDAATKEGIEIVCSKSIDKITNEISEENLTTAVNTTMDLDSESSVNTICNDAVTKEGIGIVCSKSIDKISNEISEENLTTAVNTTMELDSESTANTICNETVIKEDIEIVCSKPLNNIANEISEENLTVNKTMELNSEASSITMSNETVTKDDIKSLNKTSNEKFQENLTTPINQTLDWNSDPSMTTNFNETITKDGIERICSESINNTTNVIPEENLTTAVNITMELDSESPVNTICNDAVTKEHFEIVCSKSINNISNEISEENLTTTVNKTMELNSEVSSITMSNETVTKDDIKTLNIASNEIFQENLTTPINQTLDWNSDPSMTKNFNETITKDGIERNCSESINNTTNVIPEENLTTAVNTTMDLDSESSVNTICNDAVTKEGIGIVCSKSIDKISNEISEENLTTAVNTTMELDSESTANTICNETVIKEDIEIVCSKPLNNIANKISEENLTTTVNKTMELNSEASSITMSNETVTKDDIKTLNKTSNEIFQENLTTPINQTLDWNSDPSMTTNFNETITKDGIERICSESINNTTNVIPEENLTTAVNITMELDSESPVNTICNDAVTKEHFEIVCSKSINNISNEISEENLTTTVNKTMELNSEVSSITMSNETVTKDDIKTLNKASNEIFQENLTTPINQTLDWNSDPSMTKNFNETITKDGIERNCSESINNTTNVIPEENLTTAVNTTMELDSELSVNTISNETVKTEDKEIVCIKPLNNISNEISEENLITTVNKTMELHSEATSITISNEAVTKDDTETVCKESFCKTGNKILKESLTEAVNKALELSCDPTMTEISNKNITKDSIESDCSKSLNTSNEILEENLITAVNKTMDLSSDPCLNLIYNKMSTVITNENFTTANIEIMEPIVCDEDTKPTLNKNSEINFETSLNEKSAENIEIMKSTNITCIESFNKISSEASETNLTANVIPSECNEKSEINILSTKNDTSKLETIIQSESNKITSVISKIDIHGSDTKLPLNITIDKTDNIIKFSMNSKVPTNSSNLIDNQELSSQNQNINLKVANEDGLNVSTGLNVSSCSSELSKTLVEKNDETPYTASSPNNVQSKVENNKRIDLPDPLVQNSVLNQDQIDNLRVASNNTDSPQYFYSGQSTKVTNKLTPSQNSPSYCFDIFESSVTKLNLAEVHGNSVKKCRNNKTEIKISSEDINVDKCLNILTPIDINKENLLDDFKNIDDLSITNKKVIIEPILHEDNIKNNLLTVEGIPIDQIVTNLQNNISNMNSTNIVDIQTKQQVSNIDESLSICNQLESDKTNIQKSLNNTPPKASCSNTSAEEVFVSPRGFSWGSFFGKPPNEGTFREPRQSTIKLFDPLLNSSPKPTSTMKTNNISASSQLANIHDCKTTDLLTILNENIMDSTSNFQTQQFQVHKLNSPKIEENFGKIIIENFKPTESTFSPLPKLKKSTSVIKIEPNEKTKELQKLKRQLQSLNKLADTNDYESLEKILKQTNELILLCKYRYGHTNENLQNIIKDTEDRTYKKQKDLNQLELQLQSELDKNKNLQDETIIARNHLSKCEDALNDVQEKYQTMRERIIRYQQNETEMLKIIDVQVLKGDELNENYSSLKKQTIEDLEKLNGIYHKTKHDHETDSLALQGRIRREQLLNASLENEIKRKTEECQRLSEMCDEILLKKK